MVKIDPSVHRKRLDIVISMFFAVAHGLEIGLHGNVALDRNPPELYRVEMKRKYTNRDELRSHNFQLGPWGPQTSGETATVSRSLYEATSEGDTVCVALRQGALGIAWYNVRACPANASN